MQITAEVIADSVGPNSQRITTLEITHPLIVHAELLRHRIMSFSVASARALKNGMLKQVEEDPFVPDIFPSTHLGMQGSEILKGPELEKAKQEWLKARDLALAQAKQMKEDGVSNQLYNRLLMPWVNTKCVITATSWDNFFMLRKPPAKKKYRISKEQLAKLKN